MAPDGEVMRWDGEVSEVRDALDALSSQAGYQGREAAYPLFTADDYARALREGCALAPGENFGERPELVAAAQAHWHATGHTGCSFDATLSGSREQHGWESYVLSDGGSAADDAEAIRATLRPRFTAPQADITSVLLPHVRDSRTMAETIVALTTDLDWRLRDEGVEGDADLGEIQRIGLDVAVGLAHWSEVLGFGPFAPLAWTRRAPFCELAIRAKPPRRPRRDGRAFMAHVPIDLDEEDFGQMWHETGDQRAGRLGTSHDSRGKARVTMTLPRTEWIEIRP